MAEIPQFFVPGVGADEQEAVYAELARSCARPLPIATQRIYSITYTHDSEEWTATVGETLHGIKRRTTRAKGRKVVREVLSDPATVLAIFQGYPYVVVTNKGSAGVRSAWAKPFYVGRPDAVTYFHHDAGG